MLTSNPTLSLLILLLLCLPLNGTAQSLQNLFERVNPSVVSIKAMQRDLSGIPGDRRAVATTLVGSGVLISSDGKIITASHVVHTADKVMVEFLNGETIRADVLVTEPQADLALIKLKYLPKKFTLAALADSNRIKTGSEVFVVGAPYGIQHTVTSGIISARHRASEINNRMPLGELFQTDTAINMGHSGSPAFNMEGEVIGIISHILSQSGGFEGIGFAVTSNTIKELLLSGHGLWTGLQGFPLDSTLASVFNLPQPGGLLVEKVAKGSLSDQLGLQAGGVAATIDGQNMILGGDIVLAIMDVAMHGKDYQEKVRERLNQLINGDRIYIKVMRGGEVLWLSTEYKK